MNKQPTTRRQALLKTGKWMIIIGTGPLLLMIILSTLGFPVSDNPIGLALLAFLTFPVAVIVLLIGAFSPKN